MKTKDISSANTLDLRKLQHVQNLATRIISGKEKFERITPLLLDLRWLSVRSKRIKIINNDIKT